MMDKDIEIAISSFKVEFKVGIVDAFGIYIPLTKQCINYADVQCLKDGLRAATKRELNKILKMLNGPSDVELAG
jgi:hypothetical protein